MTVRRGLHVGFVYDSKAAYFELHPAASAESGAEFDADYTIDVVSSALVGGGCRVQRIDGVMELLARLHAGERWDLVLNLAEGLSGRNRESQVPMLLELFDLPYVGSDALTMGLTLDKAVAKRIVASYGVPTPAAVEVRSLDELCTEGLRFPVIVKASQDGSSRGLEDASLVRRPEDLPARVERVLSCYRQPALVEEFVPGLEYTVLVMGNPSSARFPTRAFPPVQVVVGGEPMGGDVFYTFDGIADDGLGYVCPPIAGDDATIAAVADLGERACIALEIADLARVDVRLDEAGEPSFLECNPLPSLSPKDVVPVVAAAVGCRYQDLLLHLVEIALDRNGVA